MSSVSRFVYYIIKIQKKKKLKIKLFNTLQLQVPPVVCIAKKKKSHPLATTRKKEKKLKLLETFAGKQKIKQIKKNENEMK